MDQERKWHRDHSERYRLRALRRRKVMRWNVAGSRLIRRTIGIVSVVLLMLLPVSLVLHWGKPGLVQDVALTVAGLIAINGIVWLIDWFIRQMGSGADGGQGPADR